MAGQILICRIATGRKRHARRLLFSLQVVLSLSLTPFFASRCEAAHDGVLGPTSTGDTDLSLSVPNLVKITGVADLNMGTYSGSGPLVTSDDVCVFTNDASGAYKVTARGSGTSFAFTLTDTNSHTMNYTVRWNDLSTVISLAADTASSTRAGGNTTSQNCSGGNSAQFEVTLTASALLSKPAGTYTGVLTLIIEPA